MASRAKSVGCFLPPAGPEPSPPPCLSRGRITFGCYNNPAKIGRTVVGAFARVLHAVPGSELVLKYLAFNEPQLRERYQIWFTAAGIAPERVRFEGGRNGIRGDDVDGPPIEHDRLVARARKAVPQLRTELSGGPDDRDPHHEIS